ncbi:B-cell receptor CD22-like [Thalassophryne amazonica]|uniref:B-cell receptor CD22-like n=1 Tax=Thalassophryne amazonica TaxID=390379 RepID=UPI00147244F1|nr:B-cell receptor CD22-like [Thalassophryne amazonica]
MTGLNGSNLTVVGKCVFFLRDCKCSPYFKLQSLNQCFNFVDLKVAVAKTNRKGPVMEGDSVNLTCINSCSGGNRSSSFTWFKNGEAVRDGPVLYLTNISSTSSGNYSCSLQSDSGSISAVKHINVEYGPKNTSVSLRPLVEVDIGSNITLICNSYANPPVENYTWFSLCDNHIVAVGHQPELHFIKFSSGNASKYLCSVTNRHGSQNSSVVMLKAKDELTMTRDIFIIGTVGLLLIVALGITIRSLSQKEVPVPKMDSAQNMQDTAIYVNWMPHDGGRSQDGNTCEAETSEVIYTTVYINTERKSDTKQQVDLKNDADVIYSTVCSDQVLNPHL